MLVERNPGKAVPGASVTAPFRGCDAANDVWCIDFKGWFSTHDGRKCYPLTLIDGFSRYLLRCEALHDPDGAHVRRILDSAFQEFGLPKAIRSDGGPPFASSGAARLTQTSVWLLRLEIEIEIIAPGKPQQNGRLERLHRTLKAETASPPAVSLVAQQRVFDPWRGQYNHVRPHEALGMRRPADVFARSRRAYPRPLLANANFGAFSQTARVDKHGFILWQQRPVLITSALQHEYVELETAHDVDGRYHVKWGAIPLGYLDEHRPGRGLVVPRRPRGSKEVTRMSFR